MSEDYTYPPTPRMVRAEELDAAMQRAEAAERERDELRALIAFIDSKAPRADRTCVIPGITLSEAARLMMAEEAEVQP